MERKMNLRNGKQYLEQGREQSDGNVTGDELEEQEDRRPQRNNNDQLMEFLISMRGEIKQDMNNMMGDFNEKMDNINENMNRLVRKIEEVKIEGLKEIKKLRQENEDFKKRIDKVQENGIKIREEIEKKVVEEVQALGKCIEENLPETILMEVTRQNEEANFREWLYFGKFDYNKNKNLNSYAMQLYNIAQYLEPAMKEEELVLYVGRHFNAEMSETIVLHNIKTMDNMSSYLQRVERSIQNGNGINRYQSENRYEDIRNDRQGENGNGIFRTDHYDRYGNTNYGNRNFENRRYQGNVDRNFGNGDRGRYNGQNNFRNSSHTNRDDFNRQYDRGVYNGNRGRNLQQQDRGNFRRDEYNFYRDQRSDNIRDNNANSSNERESVRQVDITAKLKDPNLKLQGEETHPMFW
ncbi:probable inactive serine/threonine-protein kinase scy2 [Diorhabda sublineata]|uniref:probable inactive serine/threonine-protein kinase scy2 n=1 Tax=Diorhabda sublineata TaxID=1163346 RepID=UPI0024E06FFA|nr:probable inactive serine/threonine-protein kinase scy2 [Diorhabda sublineata]